MSVRDFNSADVPRRRSRIGLYAAVLLVHVLALGGFNAALTLNRLAALSEQPLEVAILPQEAAEKKPSQKPAAARPTDEPVGTEPPTAGLPAEGETLAQTLQEPATLPANVLAVLAVPERKALQAITPEPVQLQYSVTKDGDSARANLKWHPSKVEGEQQEAPYELSYEMTYFGVSVVLQNSRGTLDATGLTPERFSERRRGKSEQATHFERKKELVTFSNNRPQAKLLAGAQDRASFLIQLASIFSGQPELFKAGQFIELPVASTSESELWVLEVQASETLTLPIGQMQAVKVLRHPRRPFDTSVEVWLAPALSYLPVRIRLTDSGGITDSQLVRKD